MEMRTITAQDGNRYLYTTADYAASNPLGIVKATLIEYVLYRIDSKEAPIAKLYKTKEGNWYDTPGNGMNTNLSVYLKRAIDQMEENQMLVYSGDKYSPGGKDMEPENFR